MNHDTLERVVKCVANTTRYPTELLTSGADLENDLGIDSVKRLEIVVALGEEFELRLDTEDRDPSIRTIGDVANWVDGFLSPAQSVPPSVENRARPQSPTRLGDNLPPNQDAFPTPQSAAPHSHAAAPHFLPNPRVEFSNSDKPLAGRVALVTGSGHGVGCVIARVLAARGATVVVNSFHSREQGEQTAQDILAQGGNAVHIWGSIANNKHVDQIFSQIDQQFGQLDMLICNASDGRIGSFLELTPEDWDRAFRTNVIGHHQCAVRAAQLMRTRGGGSIVTMSAVGANGFIDGLGSQGVAKAAVETLTRYLACELGPFGIRANCVVGGPIYGELLSKFPDAQSTQNHWESITPDGQLCSPMDLANAIAFLVSDEARGINGSVWMVDHGFSAIADGRPIRNAMRESVRTSWN